MTKLPIDYAELESIYSQSIGEGITTLAICAAQPREGVTMIAETLARRCEAVGHKTLLVDFNFSHSNLSEIFNVSHEYSILNCNNCFEHIVNIDSSNLSLLPAPSDPEINLDLRERDNLCQLFKILKDQFDVIIIDTSPLNACNRNNLPTEIVCSSAQGVIMVVLSARTTEGNVKMAVEKLKLAKAILIGTVLNDRYNPSFCDELIKSTEWLEPYAPKVVNKVHQFIRTLPLINVDL